MSKLDELVQSLCPEGVEFLPLGKVCISLNKGTLTQDKLRDTFEYPVINSGRDYYGRFSEYNNEGNAFVIASRGEYAGFISYISQKFWAGGLCYPYRSKNENKAQTKFIFYVLKNFEQKIMDSLVARGSIPALNKADIDKFLIPLPPLEVQEEIVRILDKFTILEAELEAELEAREKQYVYFRNRLLKLDDSIPMLPLGEICTVQSGGTPSKNIKEYWDQGTIKWLGSTVCQNQKTVNEVTDYISELGLTKSASKKLKKGTTLIALVGATIGKVAFLPFEAAINQNIAGVFPIDLTKLNQDYVFHACRMLYPEFIGLSQGKLAMANLSFVRSLKIPVPQLNEQERIASILDRFESMAHDLKNGLPAEIAARHKQYEYYRNQLLTFKEKEA